MTGPEHYREAERLLGQARDADIEAACVAGDDELRTALRFGAARMRARAQVHAQLALAAAAYDGLADNGGAAIFGEHGHDADALALAALEGGEPAVHAFADELDETRAARA